MEIVINKCYGGYGLSNRAVELWLIKKNIPIAVNGVTSGKYHKYYIVGENDVFNANDIKRHDPVLVEVVRELGKESWSHCAELAIVWAPDGCEYYIDEYDGMESIETWFQVSKQDLLKGLSAERIKQLKSADSIKIVD